jgi:hypothetical protein
MGTNPHASLNAFFTGASRRICKNDSATGGFSKVSMKKYREFSW